MKILGFSESYNKNQNKSFYKRSICKMGVGEKRMKILGFSESYNKNQNKSFYKGSICEMGR